MERRKRGWISLAISAVLAALGASPALAQNDRIIDTPAGWVYLYGANATQINAQISNGFRPFSIERTALGEYDTVFVNNSGPYAVAGAEFISGRTPASMTTYLNDNGLRLLDLETYDSSGSTFMAAIAVPNSGPTGTPAWGWLYNTNFSTIVTWLTDNPNLRLIDLDVYTIAGTQYYSAVAVNNSGNNAQGWWWYSGITSTQVTQELTNNDARLVAIELVSAGNLFTPATYACVMVSGNPGGGWWYPSLSTQQVSDLLAQNGARLTCLKRYTNFLGNTVWAVAMVDNANAQTRRMRGYMGSQATVGNYGFMLKQVGGPVLASLNENFAFEPASMLKILHSAYAIRQCSLGADDLSTNVFVLDRCNGNECPDNVSCNSGNESLGEVIRRTMENSDNNRTWTLETRYGRTALNNFAASRGLTNTQINHRLGCLCGEPFNSFSCVDAVNFYEEIADGTLFSTAWRDELFSRMLDLENGAGWGNYPTLNNIITQEAAGTNLTASEIADFRAAVRFANKGGGYGCGDSRWRTDGAWASIPFKVLLFGSYVTVNRQYTLATFVNDGRDPGANIAYSAKEEILREQIREALESWDTSCSTPAFFSQPPNRTAAAGASTTFPVTTLGIGSVTYRWQRQGAGGSWSNLNNVAGRYSGVTTSTLTISNIVPGDAGAYRVVITKDCGTLNSNPGTLTVTTCAVDWNTDGVVNSGDISAFLTSWLSGVQGGGLAADFNGDNAVNSGDISAFLTAWLNAVNNGC